MLDSRELIERALQATEALGDVEDAQAVAACALAAAVAEVAGTVSALGIMVGDLAAAIRDGG